MTTPAEQIQILFEISMSIRNRGDLSQVAHSGLSTYLKKLNCLAGSIYQLVPCSLSEFRFHELLTIPRRTAHNVGLQASGQFIPQYCTRDEIDHFYASLPITGHVNSNLHYHLMHLPEFGVMTLVKAGDDFDVSVIKTFSTLNEKLANTCNSTVQQRALSDSERKFRLMFESSPEAIVLVDTIGRIMDVNGRIFQWLGYHPKELIGASVLHLDLIPKPSREKIKDAFTWVLKDEKIGPFEVEFISKDGECKTGLTRTTLIRDKNGEILHNLVMISDITVLKKSQRALRESERRTKTILDSVQAGVVIVKQDDHHIEYVNSVAAQMIGLPKEKILGRVCQQFICPSKVGQCPISDLGQTIDESEKKLLKADGTTLDILKTVTPIILQGGEGSFIETFIDITERRNAEKALKDSEQRWRLLLNSLPASIMMVNKNLDILFVNHPMHGLIMEDIVGASIYDYIFPEQQGMYKMNLDKVFKTRETILTENETVNRWFISHFIPIIQDDVVSSVMIISTDVTENKKAEEALIESAQMKNDFVSNVSHELRTPLASILGFSSTILRDKNMDEEIKEEFTNIIYEESQRLSRLIEDVLNISKIEAGSIKYHPEKIKIGPLVIEVCESLRMYAEQKKVNVICRVAPNLTEILADADAMKQVVINLVNNAIKFTETGGQVVVSATSTRDNLILLVEDTGMGIPKDEISRVFEKFYRVHRPGKEIQGTGLGLPIVKEIIDFHHGRIDIDSEVNRGTRFIIHLPILKGTE